MGVGVETSAQLDGFRGAWSAQGGCPTWWMSATLDETRLATVDHPAPDGGWSPLELSEAERSDGRPKELFEARKAVTPCPLTLSVTTKADYTQRLALLVRERHEDLVQKPHPSGTLTLVVLNRVSRARQVYDALVGGRKPLCDPSKVALVHSRFRRPDRQRHETLLFSQGDRIVIATQAVEAGVDVSARLLVTELAPWASLVQRMGRCNRRADLSDAEVWWVDIQPKDDKDDLLLPYAKDELAEALEAIGKLTDASPRALREIEVREKKIVRPVIRRRDLVDLFDTTPDLCGQDIDISRYIRDGGDSDVQFFWRAIEGDAPTESDPPPHRDELCRVPIGEASKFLGKKAKSSRAWRWNPLSEQWEQAETVRPGGVYLVDVKSGGYSEDLGWTGNPKDKPAATASPDGEPETYAGNSLTFHREWQTLSAHTRLVVQETESLVAALACDTVCSTALRSAALWHDVGKAHIAFQEMLHHGNTSREGTLWAKSANKDGKCSRHGFRHELASALAWLLKGPIDATERDLVGYLIAAHHGKVRLSIRSLPDEQGDRTHPEALFARGIWDGDTLPPIPGLTTEPTPIDLSFMQMGEGRHGPSWLARAVALRDRLGPFQLAFLETLLRAADARASREIPGDPKRGADVGVSPEMDLREEPVPCGPAAALSSVEQSLVADLVADGLSIQDKFRPEPLYKQTGKGHYESKTVEEIREAKRSKPGDEQP